MTDEEIYERCVEPVERFFINKVRNDDDVEDLMHETFVRFIQKRKHGVVCNEPIGFLIGIAKNVLHEYWRSKDRRDRHEDIGDHSLADMGSGISTIIGRAENQKIVLTALRQVRLDYQIVLELFFWEKMSYEAIADSIGKPSATVGTWLRRGKEELGELIKQAMEQSGTDLEDPRIAAVRGAPNGKAPDALDDLMADAKEATSRRSETPGPGRTPNAARPGLS